MCVALEDDGIEVRRGSEERGVSGEVDLLAYARLVTGGGRRRNS
ncbi:MAG: hypothetical protein ACKERG_00205 [Candidatus Hodgkinia cicadicola]